MIGGCLSSNISKVSKIDGEINSIIYRPLISYLQKVYGAEALEKVALAARIPTKTLCTFPRWISYAEFDVILNSSRNLLKDDEEFKRAVTYDLRSSLGIFLPLLSATSVSMLYTFLAKTMPLGSRVSHYEIVESSSSRIVLRYVSEKTESRLMCLSRSLTLPELPGLFGLPPASLIEHSCIAHGANSCLYEIEWYENPRSWRMLLGFIAAVAVAATIWPVISPNFFTAFLLLLMGYLIGKNLEQRRVIGNNLQRFSDTHRAVEQLSAEVMRASEELYALNQRQEDWNQLLEQQIDMRTRTMQHVVEELKQMRQESVLNLRDVTHDLRNPLSLISNCHEYMSLNYSQKLDAEQQKVFEIQGRAIVQLKNLINELVDSAKTEADAPLNLERIETALLAKRLESRLRALVMGRKIQTRVLILEDAPLSMMIDEIIFDRIVDNLLTNAAKYTQQGFITVEFGGNEDMLCLRITDTGRGISRDKVDKILENRSTDISTPQQMESHRVGLSSVIRLLNQLGGRLDISSQPGVGTTVWVYIPAVFAKKESLPT